MCEGHDHKEQKRVNLATSVLAANDSLAQENRDIFKDMLVVNLVSSPGSGKTSILERSLLELRDEFSLAVIEGDVFTDRDAQRIKKTGVSVIQINTGGACHLDAKMIRKGVDQLDLDGVDLLFIENVGNLVCPAGFDLGEDFKVTVLSTTEGDDKPAKYPAMFKKSAAVLVNKVDLKEALEIDLKALDAELFEVSPQATVFHVSAKTGEGFAGWLDWLKAEIKKKQAIKLG